MSFEWWIMAGRNVQQYSRRCNCLINSQLGRWYHIYYCHCFGRWNAYVVLPKLYLWPSLNLCSTRTCSHAWTTSRASCKRWDCTVGYMANWFKCLVVVIVWTPINTGNFHLYIFFRVFHVFHIFCILYSTCRLYFFSV